MNNKVLHTIHTKIKEGKKQFAVLIDPDKMNDAKLQATVQLAVNAQVDFFLVGGSLLTLNNLEHTIQHIKATCTIPVVLFPGNTMQVNKHADAILLLSLISGRNADLLIGQQVQAAPLIKAAALETIATGYILIDGGKPTAVSYISNTSPIPADKPEIATATALAGQMLGLQCLYLEAGSGAKIAVTETMIKSVKKETSLPLFVGGGIHSAEKALDNCHAGADIIVVGNAIEKDHSLIQNMASAIHHFSINARV